MIRRKLILITLLIILIPACSKISAEPLELTVMTHDSFAVSEDVIASFELENNVSVTFIEAGDTGTAVNKAILSKNAPLADVFYGVDNTFLSRALGENVFEAYESPVLKDIPDQYKVDPQNRALPVDYGDVCLNYDIDYLAKTGLNPPDNLDDLLKPEYKGLLVVENPATSSPGLAFLFATIGRYGETGYLDFWRGLVENDLKVVNDWETAYYSEFSRWGGTRPIVVSYGSSPPFEIIFAEEPMVEAPTAAVVGEGSCFRQIEFVGILKGTGNRDLAEKFVDFILSPTFQEDIPLQMYVFPVNENAHLDETFTKYLAEPENPVTLDPKSIADNREKWIVDWTEVVLR
ncbi:ABC transporter substrate-binding protein [bacterium SM23_57]|jgi:thiamine transport system substrate-binding protein|nr:MAG: ABC transporter substrate-binding protein [bacterium SM23_57]